MDVGSNLRVAVKQDTCIVSEDRREKKTMQVFAASDECLLG